VFFDTELLKSAACPDLAGNHLSCMNVATGLKDAKDASDMFVMLEGNSCPNLPAQAELW